MCQVHSYPEAPLLILDSGKNKMGSLGGSFSHSEYSLTHQSAKRILSQLLL